MDDDRTVPGTPKRVTQRRQYDVSDLLTLACGDIGMELQPYDLSEELKEKLAYWLGRAWDLGRAAAEKK